MDYGAELGAARRLVDGQERVRRLCRLVAGIDAARTEALAARDEAIRGLRQDGHRVVDIVRLTGLTRARINQILAATQ